MILSASRPFHDHDCEMLYGQFACYCYSGIVWIELLWPVRQLRFACYGVILSASSLVDSDQTIERFIWPVRCRLQNSPFFFLKISKEMG